jgi:spectrin beta
VQLSSEPAALEEEEQEEWVEEVRLVPQDYWEKEPVLRIEHRTVLEDRHVLRVRSLYPFTGPYITMQKDEVMLLHEKTNYDWWCVRKADGTEGFVPANYVREIVPKVVQVQVSRREETREMQRVKKTMMVKQSVPTRRVRPVKPAGECVVCWEPQNCRGSNRYDVIYMWN